MEEPRPISLFTPWRWPASAWLGVAMILMPIIVINFRTLVDWFFHMLVPGTTEIIEYILGT